MAVFFTSIFLWQGLLALSRPRGTPKEEVIVWGKVEEKKKARRKNKKQDLVT